MNYFDTKTNQVNTEAVIKLRGLPLDNVILAQAGIYPVNYNHATHDPDVEVDVPDGELIFNENTKTFTQNFKVEDLKDSILKQNLNRIAEKMKAKALKDADNVVQSYLSQFSEVEKMTFPSQQKEVEAWLADNTSATPVLDSLAEARGITREEQIQKAVAKVQLFVPLSAKIIGTQQKYEDDIKIIKENEAMNLKERIIAIKNLSFTYPTE